jgi:hypothetical protein
MLKSQMIPAHPQPMPSILAKDQLAYTAMRVATFIEKYCKLMQHTIIIQLIKKILQ